MWTRTSALPATSTSTSPSWRHWMSIKLGKIFEVLLLCNQASWNTLWRTMTNNVIEKIMTRCDNDKKILRNNHNTLCNTLTKNVIDWITRILFTSLQCNVSEFVPTKDITWHQHQITRESSLLCFRQEPRNVVLIWCSQVRSTGHHMRAQWCGWILGQFRAWWILPFRIYHRIRPQRLHMRAFVERQLPSTLLRSPTSQRHSFCVWNMDSSTPVCSLSPGTFASSFENCKCSHHDVNNKNAIMNKEA